MLIVLTSKRLKLLYIFY